MAVSSELPLVNPASPAQYARGYARRYRRTGIAAFVFLSVAALLFFLHRSGLESWRFRPSAESLKPAVAHIPETIWQIMLPKNPTPDQPTIEAGRLENTASWLALNPNYFYLLVDQKGGDDFIHQHFSHRPDIIETYTNMPNVGMKSDMLRYLLLSVEGGVYTDTDTIALQPIDKWIPSHIRNRTRVIVGIEYDRREGPAWADIPHVLQFCQWTIAAAPGHPVFDKMVNRIINSARLLAEEHKVPLNQVKPESIEVMNSTGPAAWTDVVFEQLQELEPWIKQLTDLSYMKEPTLYGDMLVLPIDGFGMGQPHSDSTNDGSIPPDALARHLFKGTWRGN
ncbi:unnamed protein product [Clonostachys rhizophaga]|uniref:Initiation-specific alpha-1,6-mannosyltransferase n=1 Tax=Clonostachys rhizophaga TaxID=160324 RepID=A0A9N9VBJ3_9HYPO|nr:unnamed protein product [Clonostachys rhizophaga]